MKEFIKFLLENNISIIQSRREKIYNFIRKQIAKEIIEMLENEDCDLYIAGALHSSRKIRKKYLETQIKKCPKCGNEKEFKHKHDCAHGIEATHMSGTERYICMKCEHMIFKTEGEPLGFKFILD